MVADTEAILRAVEHRPWPLPRGPWIMVQGWRDLLFAHWAVEPDRLRGLVPEPLELDTFDGRAWIGLTPFRMTGLRARLLPAFPGVSEFPEMNLRTYVRYQGRAGIFFFTLEAGSALAVTGGRTFYRLPYHTARMEVRDVDGWFAYRSARDDGSAAFEGRYRPTGPSSEAEPGSLEHFLTERYALYAVLRDGGVLRGDIHHRPWPLQPAEAEIATNTVPAAHGITLPPEDPLLHFAARQDTLVWPPVRV